MITEPYTPASVDAAGQGHGQRTQHTRGARTSTRLLAALAGSLLVTTACAPDHGVETSTAHRIEEAPPATDPPTPSTEPDDPTPPPTDPDNSTPPPTPGEGGELDLGDDKPQREYDDFVALALADLERWWTQQYPLIENGDRFRPLEGSIYPAYPERTHPIPGCGSNDPMTYEEITQYGALYCDHGDFMVYDDGDTGILYQLASEFGQSIVGVVLAHEYGHAIQERTGALRQNLPTVTTEQQADCFAGAWVAHVHAGDAEGIEFTDDDIRDGLVAMITVRDPIGIDTSSPGGHGSAFDRVGAFQVGFTEGVERCAELIENPLPLVPNEFRVGTASSIDGNSPFGYREDEVGGFVVTDLNDFWSTSLTSIGVTMTPMTLVAVQSAGDVVCDAPASSFSTGAVACPATNQVFLDEPLARDLYDRFGDFVVGYLVGGAWSEAAQVAMGSPLEGEKRALVNDCLTGAWAASMIPDEQGQTRSGGGAIIEPGDLDEAIQTALVVGDDSSSDDVLGSGFEKIAAFRSGVLNGVDACNAMIKAD